MNKEKQKSQTQKVRNMVSMAMLAAVAVVLMMFKVPLPFLPSFYKLDISELPVIIGAFAMGPWAGVVIGLLKNLLNLLVDGTTTAFVGEFANFLIGCSYVVPASLLYFRRKSKKNAVAGLLLGTLVCIVVGCLVNAYLLLPAYGKAFHMDMEALIAIGTKVNSSIDSLLSFVIFATAPFNLLKCGLVSVITMLIYKPISRIVKGE